MTIGWDIGGVNTKVARVAGGAVVDARSRPYELQRAPARLASLLRELAGELGGGDDARHAVTMTAELSQMFRTKREGVGFVLDAVEAAFPAASISVYTVDNTFIAPADARRQPRLVAAANWAATAHVVARHHPDAILIDVGTTTTDVIPIAGGAVAALARTDPDRLASGELVYTGALRTPVEAIVSHVPYRGGTAAVSAESFALIGDVHVWRGDLADADYTVPTPDGRPATPPFAMERLARIICADRELIDDAAVSRIADAVAAAQVEQVAQALRRVAARHPSLRTAVVTGLGSFIAERAAHAAGLTATPLAEELGDSGARSAPATAVALLLEQRVSPIVVKIGGALLEHRQTFDAALLAVEDAARDRPLLVVPGGGPFADAVRRVDARVTLSDDAAHWMAVLAMDQYAQLLASRLPHAVIVNDAAGVQHALAARRIPVLAPSQWLHAADPLPHTWEVTSDSIAAWVAGAIGASGLVLIKAPGASGASLVDRGFAQTLPLALAASIVTADDVPMLHRALRGPSAASIRFNATVR
jgi:probable H4MPT-linked C1 transfer pathway protein